MSHCRDKLKCLIVLGGVALALMPCLQQTHALCQLAGCIEPLLSTPIDAIAANGLDCDRCCSHKLEPPREKPNHDRGDDLPCGPDCWCVQLPDPPEAPRNATESAKSQIYTLHAEFSPRIDIEWQLNCGGLLSLALDSLPRLSAGETCVRLCRFLT